MHSFPNISCYFITLSDIPEISLDGDILRIPGRESYEGIIVKTIAAIEYFTARKSYDFVIRTNISSIWNYARLNEYLRTLPRTGLYAGLPGGEHGQIKWVSGSGMILTPDTCKKLLDARELVFSFKIIDDVDIGYAFHQLGVPVTMGMRHDVYNDTLEIPRDFYHYRVRLLPEPENVIHRTTSCMLRIRDLM